MTALWDHVVVQGDSAFLSYMRLYRDRTRHEVVVFRVDADTTEWRLVRRVPVGHALESIALPDGRVYQRWNANDRSRYTITEYPPGAPPRQVYRIAESDDPFFQLSSMLPGPVP